MKLTCVLRADGLNLYSAIASVGSTIYFLLSPKRDLTAAKGFLPLALGATRGWPARDQRPWPLGICNRRRRVEGARRVYMKLPLALLICFSFAMAPCEWAATTYDPAASFEQGFLSKSNPNGVWSYGSSMGMTGPVSLFTQTTQDGTIGPNVQFWSPGAIGTGNPYLFFNNGPALKTSGQQANLDILANQIVLSPEAGLNSDVVFTAPVAGTYSVTGNFRGDLNPVAAVAGVVANGGLLLSAGITSDGQSVPFTYTVSLPAGGTVVFSVGGAGNPYITYTGLTVSISGPLVAQIPYYFSQFAVGGGWQTTLTLVNYSPQPVTCVTNFYSDIGSALSIPFTQGSLSTRTDTLQGGQSIHDQTTGSATAVTQGWAQSVCTGPVHASVLYRLYQAGTPVGEASVNADVAPTTEFATFAQTATGVAYANPSTTQSANITLTVYDTTGNRLGSQIVTLGPLAHGSANLGPLLGITSFTGFVKITSTLPIVSLSLNAEAFPVFSSLPPGDLASSTLLVTP